MARARGIRSRLLIPIRPALCTYMYYRYVMLSSLIHHSLRAEEGDTFARRVHEIDKRGTIRISLFRWSAHSVHLPAKACCLLTK